jgi:hypothetical protein
VFEIGEVVRWMEPLDHEYSYGTILSIKNNVATLAGTGYYTGRRLYVHLRYIEHLERGLRHGSGKKYRK